MSLRDLRDAIFRSSGVMGFGRCALALLTGALLTGCQSVPVPDQANTSAPAFEAQAIRSARLPRLAIATAYAPEFRALIPHLEHPVEYRIEGVSYWLGSMRGQDVILFETGVSMVNASMNTERLLNHFNVESLIVSGVAGGLDPALTIGDVTVPARWAQYNESVYMRETAPGEYSLLPGVELAVPPFDFMGTRGVRIARDDDPKPLRKLWFETSPELLEITRQAAQKAELKQCDDEGLCLPESPEVVVGGSGVTGSIFMDNARYRQYLHETFEAGVAEMETAAIAMVSYAHDVPFIAFRSLSDLAGGGQAEQNEITAFQHLAAENSAALVMAFLDVYAAERVPPLASLPPRDYCEINFSAAPTYSGGAISEELRTALKAEFSDVTSQKGFLASQIKRSEYLASLALKAGGWDYSPDILAVWGGYKGEVDPSLVLRFETKAPAGRDAAELIAASLGFVFMQQGVIVQCSGGAGEALIPSFDLTETGDSDVLSPETLKPVFGMMLGEADGNFDLGFTYYPEEDRFSTLGLTDGGAFERAAMGQVRDSLVGFTGDESGLLLGETGRWVNYLSNDWGKQPDGAAYWAVSGMAAILPELKKERAEFVGELKAFVGEVQ